EEHLLAKAVQLGRRVTSGEAGEHDQQRVALADQGESLGIVGVRTGHQAGRVEELDGGRRDLLGLVEPGQKTEAGVRVRSGVATPTWPEWILPGSGRTPVRSSNSVLLPPPANPTIPTCILRSAPDRASRSDAM